MDKEEIRDVMLILFLFVVLPHLLAHWLQDYPL